MIVAGAASGDVVRRRLRGDPQLGAHAEHDARCHLPTFDRGCIGFSCELVDLHHRLHERGQKWSVARFQMGVVADELPTRPW